MTPADALALAAKSILAHEGWRLQVYDDATGRSIEPGVLVKGKPTIGVGCLLSAPGGLTRDEVELLFANRLQPAVSAAQEFAGEAWEGIGEVRQAALVEMAYQMGRGGLMGFHAVRRDLARGWFEGAAEAMLNSRWATQTPARARTLAERMRTGRIEA